MSSYRTCFRSVLMSLAALVSLALTVPEASAESPGDGRLSEEMRDVARLAIDAVKADPNQAAIRELIRLDAVIADCSGAEAEQLQATILETLARSGHPAAIDHLHGVFETQTERRDEAAVAISLSAGDRPTDLQDWRYLIRSLNVVEGAQARTVLQALRRFRQRATRPSWLRQVILLGLALDPDGQRDALRLLEHWAAGLPDLPPERDASEPAEVALTDWQNWFRARYPEEPDPLLPTDRPDAKWKFAELAVALKTVSAQEKDIERGRAVFHKARCDQCHVKGGIGEKRGPDLNTVGWRLQIKEQLEAVLFPSFRLNTEEYPAVKVVSLSGREFSGLVIERRPDRLKIVDQNGKVLEFAADEIDEVIQLTTSTMPEGLLDSLTIEEIRDLFAFLDAA